MFLIEKSTYVSDYGANILTAVAVVDNLETAIEQANQWADRIVYLNDVRRKYREYKEQLYIQLFSEANAQFELERKAFGPRPKFDFTMKFIEEHGRRYVDELQKERKLAYYQMLRKHAEEHNTKMAPIMEEFEELLTQYLLSYNLSTTEVEIVVHYYYDDITGFRVTKINTVDSITKMAPTSTNEPLHYAAVKNIEI